MKNNNKLIPLIVIVCSFSTNHANAQGKWGEKATSIFKKQDQSVITKGPGLGEIGDAFKEALRIGSENVVRQLGADDGFNADPAIHIPLPDELKTVSGMLSSIGMSQSVDDLELKLNRAAEAASPKDKALFLQSIKEMTFDDVKEIYNGPNDSATRYFQGKMSQSLKNEMQPIVNDSLSSVGAFQSFGNVIGEYKKLPFVPDIKSDLTNHVIQKGMDGIFYYIAKEEASIRTDPVKQTTNLLKKVFGENNYKTKQRLSIGINLKKYFIAI